VAEQQPGPGGAERRVWVRYPCNVQTAYQAEKPHPESIRLLARVQNISQGGISLLVDRPLNPGLQLSVELPDDASGQPSGTVLAYLTRVTATPAGDYALGCTFAVELPAADLEPFGAQPVRSGVPTDKRVWVRFPCSLPATFQFIRTDDPKRWPATVLDLSAGGMALQVDTPVEVGTTLRVEVRRPDQPKPFSQLMRVVRAVAQPGHWRLGCSFIRELSAQELEAFTRSHGGEAATGPGPST
jgi:c-di-GMP-binding flagellar brake protein YcgR